MSSSYFYSPVPLSSRARVSAPCRVPRVRHFGAVLFLFCALCLQLGVRIAIVERGYRLESARKQLLENDKQLRQYRLQYAVHTSPERLARLAQQKLGMGSTRPQQIRKIG